MGVIKKTLIYKEDLLETILDYFGMDLAYYGRDLQFCQEAIEQAPAVERWIPVSDEIPEQYHSVIGWTKFKEMGEVMHDGKQFVWADEETVPAFVTHWMPFPEPPKEVE